MVADAEGQVSAATSDEAQQQVVPPSCKTPTRYVMTVIENTAAKVYLDTGSDISLISETFRMSIPSLRTKPMQRSQLFPRSVTGDYLDDLGTLPITIRLGNEIFIHTVQVVRNITQPIILGWDFLLTHHAVVDLREGMFKVGNRTSVPLLCATETAPLSCNAVTLAPVVVPAMSQMTVLAKVQPAVGVPDYEADYTGILEPNLSSYQGLLVARTLAPVQTGLTYVRIMNPTNADLQVPCDTRLGDFHPIGTDSDDDYCVVEANVATVATTTEPSPSRSVPDVHLNHSELTTEQRQQLETLLLTYRDIFSANDHDYGRTDIVRHSIKTTDVPPIKQRAYRTSPNVRTEIDRQVQQLLSRDIIEDSCSPWSSPVVLVRKKDGSFRFCIDYRKLNAVTIKDSYPLPRPADALDSLSGACWFSTMDLSSGYWQVELEPNDKEKTAFNTGSGLYQFKVMPMGLTNAPPTFQRLMELVLHGLHWKECLIYLDDVLVFSRSFADHLQNLREVFSRFRSAGLMLKGRKCQLARTQVTFLGHIVSNRGLQPDARNLEKVSGWPTPRTATEVRAFIGLCSYYRRFVKNFSVIAAPLHTLTQKGAIFKWTVECEDAFQSLKHALTHPPIVAHPMFTQPFLLYTDASQVSIGSVLAQRRDNREHVIAYASHTLSTSERKWSTFDRELWAVVWSVRHFKHFLSGSSFTVITDHKPLLSLKKTPVDNDPTGRRSRWILELDVYDYNILHRNGEQHANADAMSRRPNTETQNKAVQCVISAITSPDGSTPVGSDRDDNTSPVLTEIHHTLSVDLDKLQEQQREDEGLTKVIGWLEDRASRPPIGHLKHSSPTLRKLWHEFPKLIIRHGILCRKTKTGPYTPDSFQVVLPAVLIHKALVALHGNPFSGHLSAERTLLRARRICYWPYMSRDIHKFCAECLPCQTRGSPTPHERAPLQSIQAERPFQKIAADITELPVTTQGNRYVLVIMDYFTRYVNLFPLKDQRATTVAKCIFEDYIRQHGLPESIHTDQGRQFESDLIKHLCTLLGITKTRTSPYHAQSDGMVERLNRTLKDQLAKYISHTGGEWDQYLPQAELAYNSSVHSSTGFSPFFLVHGREPNLPLDVMLNCSPAVTSPTPGSPAAYAKLIATRLSHAFKDAAQNTAANKLHQKTQYDKKLLFHSHQPGDLVLLDDPVQKMNKLAPRWKGPFVVQRRLSRDGHPGVTYEITDPRNARSRTWIVHHNRLKAYKGTLPYAPVDSEAPSVPTVGRSETSAPSLTALSGALPFRPPTPPYVPTTTKKQPALPRAAHQNNAPPCLPPPSPCPSSPSPSSPVAHMDCNRPNSAPHVPRQVTSRGHQIRRPPKYRDFVT